MTTTARAATLAACLTAFALTTSAWGQEAPQPQPRLDDLLRQWAKSTERRLLVEPRLGLDQHPVPRVEADRANLIRLTRHAGALLIESERSVEVVHERNARQAFGRYVPRLVRQDDPLPAGNVPVRVVYQLRHAGSELFMSLRAETHNDSARLTQVHFLPKRRRLVLVGLAPSVAYLRDLARSLDAPDAAPPPCRVSLYQVGAEDWAAVSELSPRAAGERLAAALKAGRVERLESARVAAVGERLQLSRELQTQRGRLSVHISTYQPSPPKGQAARPEHLETRLRVQVRQEGEGSERASRDFEVRFSPAQLVGVLYTKDPQPSYLVLVIDATR